MKKPIVIVSVFILLCLLTTAGVFMYHRFGQEEKGTDSSDRTYSFMDTSYLPEGIFKFDGKYLNFIDAATGDKSIICDDAACKHEYKRNSRCGAVFYDVLAVQGITIWEGDLVFIASNGDLGKNAVYQSELNGKNRKQIAELPYMETIYQAAYHKQMLYIAYQNQLSAEMEEYTKTEAGIYALNLETGRGNTLFYQKEYSASVYGMAVNDACLSFSYSFVDADAKEILENKEDAEYTKKHLRKEVFVYNRNTEKEIFSAEGECFGSGEVVKDCILYMKDGSAYIHNIQTGKSKMLYEDDMYQIPVFDEGRMYFKAYDTETGGSVYYSYQPEKDVWNEIGKIGLSVEAICGDTVYVYSNENASQGCGFMLKKDFLEGNDKECRWQKEEGRSDL